MAVELAGSVKLADATGAAVAADLGGTVALRGLTTTGFEAGPASNIQAQTREARLLFLSYGTR